MAKRKECRRKADERASRRLEVDGRVDRVGTPEVSDDCVNCGCHARLMLEEPAEVGSSGWKEATGAEMVA